MNCISMNIYSIYKAFITHYFIIIINIVTMNAIGTVKSPQLVRLSTMQARLSLLTIETV